MPHRRILVALTFASALTLLTVAISVRPPDGSQAFAAAVVVDAGPDGIATSPAVVAAEAPEPDFAAPPDPSLDLGGWASALYRAIQEGRGIAAAGLVLLGLVFAVRTLGVRYVDWLSTTAGGVVLALITSFGGYLGTALAAGQPFSLSAALSALVAFAAAAGLWEWLTTKFPALKDLVKAPTPKAPA